MKKKFISFFQFLTHLSGDQRGFSLAEIMVAAGMLGVLSLGVTQLMQNSAKTEKRLGQQINLLNLEGEIQAALKSKVGCTRTLNGLDAGGPAGPVSANTTASTWVDAPDVPYAAIFYENGGFSETNQSNWRKVVEAYDGSGVGTSTKGVYGAASNMITVEYIKYRGYYQKTDPANGLNYGNDSNYVDTSGATDIGTSGLYSGTVVILVSFTRGNYKQYETMTEEQASAASNKKAYGAFRINRFYPVQVIANSSHQILSCATVEDTLVSATCEALGGFYDADDQRCKNIKLSDTINSAAGPPPTGNGEDNDWPIATEMNANNTNGGILAAGNIGAGFNHASEGPNLGMGSNAGNIRASNDIQADNNILAEGNLRANGHLIIGSPFPAPNNNTGAGDGSFSGVLRVGQDLFVTGNSSVGGDSAVAGNSTVAGYLSVGSPSAGPTTPVDGEGRFSGNLRVDGTGLIGTSRLTVGDTAIDTASSLSVTGTEKILFNTNTQNTTFNDGSFLYRGAVSGTQQISIDNTGKINVYNSGAPVIEIGVGSGTYRPIYIRGQSVDKSTINFGSSAPQGLEAATKAWVRTMIYGSWADNSAAKVETILDSIADYAQHHSLDTIKRQMCESIVLATGGATSICSWTGSACNCEESNCSDTGSTVEGQPVCGNMTLGGNLLAANVTGSNNVTANNRVYGVNHVRGGRMFTDSYVAVTGGGTPTGDIGARHLRAAYDVYANRNISAAGRVNAARVVAPQVCQAGTSGNYYCYTKFGKVGCSGDGFMIGIAYGHPICATSGGGGSSGVRL